jgi:ADP-ribosylglycohydrolase
VLRGGALVNGTARDRLVGSIVAGAIGDALGAPIEFDDFDAIRRRYGPTGVTDFAPACGRVGAITDDTQMTLFTAEGLLRARGDASTVDDIEAIRRSYLRWLSTQGLGTSVGVELDGWMLQQRFLHERRAPGNTCLSALHMGGKGSPEAPCNSSKGCGGVMRVAPIAALPHDWFEVAVHAAAITHGHPSGYLSAGALAYMLGECVHGTPLVDAVERAVTALARWADHDETLQAIRNAQQLATRGHVTPEDLELLGGGWVGEEALAIGLCCALTAPDVRSGLLLAVNHSGDSDSTGAIAGNLLGAVHGIDGLPRDLLDALEGRDVIERVADDLADVFVDEQPVDVTRYPPS